MDFLKQLSNNPDLIKRINENVFELNNNFNAIKALVREPLSDENFNKAFQLFIDIFDLIPLMVNNLTIPQIVRGRRHERDDVLVSEEWQLSYNLRYSKKIKLGRFNREWEPLFYGSLPTESENIDYVLSCALECCKELTIEYETPDVQDISVSGWEIKEPFFVVNLCFNDKHLTDNPTLKQGVELYLKAINDSLSKEAAEFIESFLRYFSELSCTTMSNNESYQITTALFNAIRYSYEEIGNSQVYGLIYPSAMLKDLM